MEPAALQAAVQAEACASCGNHRPTSRNAAAGGMIKSRAMRAKAPSVSSSGHSAAPAGKGSHAPPRRSAWQQLGTLLCGFRHSGLEDRFLAYKYQQTRMLDTCTAVYHTAVALALVAAFPAAAWLQWRTLLHALGVVLGWAVPPFVVMRVRPSLSPKGRELAVLLVDVSLGLQGVCIARGWLVVSHSTSAKMELNKCMDFCATLVACGIIRAILSQARTRLFALSSTMYMVACMHLAVRIGVPVHLAVLRYGAVLLVAVVVSAALELHSRASFQQLVSCEAAAAYHKAAPSSSKQQPEQQQTRLHQHAGEEASSSGGMHSKQQAGSPKSAQAAAQYLDVLEMQAQPSSTTHQLSATGSGQCSFAPAGASALQEAALHKLATLLGPDFRQQLAAASLAMGPGDGAQRLLEFQGYSQMHQVGIKVRSEEHAMGTPGFQHMADMLTSIVCEAASCVMAPGHGPYVRATCVQGCMQLLAGIHLAPGAHVGVRAATSDATRRSMEAALQALVHTRLQAIYLEQEVPAFEVTVQTCVGSGSSSTGSGGNSGTDTSSSSAATTSGAVHLRSCKPPCLAAGVGSSQLELLLDARAACSFAASGDGSTRTEPVAGRLVIWGLNGEVLVDAKQHLAHGHNAIRVPVPTPEQPGLLHMAVLLGSHSLAFVQPLLVLPEAAATELHQVWSMAVALATDKVCGGHVLQPEVQESAPPSAALAEAWQQITPLLMDVAYVVGCTAPLATTAAATAMVSSASGGECTLTEAASPELQVPVGQSWPWLGGQASAAHQELLVHLIAGLYSAGLWATTDFVCGAAAASGRVVGSKGGRHEQAGQQEEQQAQYEDDTPCGVAARAAAVRLQHGAPGRTAKAASHIAAVLLYPALLLFTSVQRVFVPQRQEAHAASAAYAAASSCKATANSAAPAAASSNKAHASAGVSDEATLLSYAPGSLRRQLLTLLTGFKQPHLEQAFLAHRFQHTRSLDACAAVYHGLIVIAAAISYPADSWHQGSTQWGMACVVLGAGLPAVMAPVTLVPRLRALLGPRGRELLALGVDVAMALQGVAIACGLAALPEFVRGRLMAESGFKDEVMIHLAVAVMRPLLGQARVKWFAMSISSYCATNAWAAIVLGMPCSHAVWRYVRVATTAITIAAAAELHARQVFLKLAGAAAVTVQGVGCAGGGDAKKHV